MIKEARNNRILIIILSILLVVSVLWGEYRTHTLAECEIKCYEHITGVKLSKEGYEKFKGDK